jgi:hypothetical protein
VGVGASENFQSKCLKSFSINTKILSLKIEFLKLSRQIMHEQLRISVVFLGN